MFHEVVLILKNTKNSYVSLFFVEVWILHNSIVLYWFPYKSGGLCLVKKSKH
jgi:hypothetical protein